MPTTIQKKKEVQDYIESRGGRLLSPYENAKTKIHVIGACGHKFEMKFNDIKKRNKDKVLCQKCNSRDSQNPLSNNDWINRGLEIGFKDIEIINNKVNVVCSCGHRANMSFSGYKKRIQTKRSECRSCQTNRTRDFSRLNAMSLVRRGGGTFIDIEKNNSENYVISLKYKCGHNGSETLESLQRKEKQYGILLCPKCSIEEHKSTCTESSQEKEIVRFIREIGFDVKSKYRESYPYGQEIDAFIENRMVSFEVDGIYWHSEDKGKTKNWHLLKKKHFKEKGIELYNFWDIEINKKSEIVKSMIKNRLGISDYTFYARECTFKKIDASTAKDFFNKTHIQGGNGVTNNSFALYIGKNIVAAMSFRNSTNGDKIELYRFSTALNTSVVGGFSKILKNAIKHINFTGTIVTYADLRFSSLDYKNTVYYKNGFTFIRQSPPNYRYFKDSSRLYNRVEFQKHKLKDKLEIFDEKLTEVENMRKNGFNRIFDCGNLVFEMKV